MAKMIESVGLVAVAQAAFRTNGNQLLKDAKGELNSNGMLVKEYVYHGKPTVTVTEEDHAQAEVIRGYITQRVMLSKLTGRKLSDFIVKIGEMLDPATTSIKNAGLVAWAPKVYADLLKADEQQQEFSHLGITSGYLGRVGEKIEFEFHTVSKRWTNVYNCFRYAGHDGKGNLVGFLCKHDYPAVVKLKARIKATETAKISGGKTTYVNYTRAIK